MKKQRHPRNKKKLRIWTAILLSSMMMVSTPLSASMVFAEGTAMEETGGATDNQNENGSESNPDTAAAAEAAPEVTEETPGSAAVETAGTWEEIPDAASSAETSITQTSHLG